MKRWKRLRVLQGYNNCSGSLTVEASLTFPVFVCLFLALLFFVRLASINITLNHVVHEAAKQIAASCYPISYLNELEDEIIPYNPDMQLLEVDESEEEGIVSNEMQNEYKKVLSLILDGGTNETDFADLFMQIGTDLFSDWFNDKISDKIAGQYFKIKSQAERYVVMSLIRQFLADTAIDSEKLELVFFELPQSQSEFDIKQKNSDYLTKCSSLGFVPQKDEVVIVVKYKVGLHIPFFTVKELKIVKTAVERAWLNGSYGVYAKAGSAVTQEENNSPKGDEGGEESNEPDSPSIDDEEKTKEGDEEEYVYITRTGARYHKRECTYLSKSRIPIEKSEAETKGYTPCKICIGGKKLFER